MKPIRALITIALLILTLSFTPPPTLHGQSSGYVRSPYLGITFISSAEHPADENRYRNALLLGAGWNRYPFYWNYVETFPGVYNWDALDRVVTEDLQHGLKTNAILMGIPEHARQGNIMRGLYAPIFSDGSDYAGAGKTPNVGNPWAAFVYEAVTRYKPGGILSRQPGREYDEGIQVWEIWNEPDYQMFWSGTTGDYARLLKVAYTVIRLLDPYATVLFGGLSFAQPNTHFWFGEVLYFIYQDPARGMNNWYFDKVALHSYGSARRTAHLISLVQGQLTRFGLTRPLWLNESGVPVWDDYPGPTWTANSPDSRRWRGTQAEQALYVIQNTTLAWASGVEVVFFHQLYDDCGNQAGGTDFPPNNGNICTNGACWGDAFGLYRNERTATCFRQHPQPGTPRPAASAFYRLAQVFGATPFVSRGVINLEGAATVLVFERTFGGERIYVAWGDSTENRAITIPASGSAATLYTLRDQQTITPVDGSYRLAVNAAQRGGFISLTTDADALGGEPVILVEPVIGGAAPDTNRIMLEGGSPRSPLTSTPGALVIVESVTATPIPPTAHPTTDPAFDTTPPTAQIAPLPEISPPSFTVTWEGSDNSGIANFILWVRVNGGEWQPWLETSDRQAIYTGSTGQWIEFAIWAVDLAGNWSTNVELSTQAITTIQ
ncbi:MAG: hypothetical protein IAE80_15585 [Anaerolinea sp.]|nr:hypothetical protein [Anaerolinea sp.]